MANRAFKYLTIQAGGTPQPVVGSYLTAPLTQGQVDASMAYSDNVQSPVTLTVDDSSVFQKGDYVNVVDPTTFATERGQVYSVPDATHIKVYGLKSPHPGGAYGTGAWVANGSFAQSVYIQAKDGNTGALYIGTQPQMVKASGAFVISVLQLVAAGSQPYEFSTSRQGLANAETLSQYWIDGTTGDSYLPSIGEV
jgi:hypothetical protein